MHRGTIEHEVEAQRGGLTGFHTTLDNKLFKVWLYEVLIVSVLATVDTGTVSTP